MLNESWKQRLIRYAHPQGSLHIPARTRWDFPKTILGRKIIVKRNMIQSLDWLQKLKGEVLYDEPLSLHTSFRIGGPADVFVYPKDIADLRAIFAHADRRPVFFLGEGTNLLVRDAGIRGIVVSLKEHFRRIKSITFAGEGGDESAVIRAGAGVKMSYLAKYAARHSLTGIEGLVGVPGSLGGAVVMNAGAEGHEIGQVIKSVTRLTRAGEVQTLTRAELEFQYRKTVFPPGDGVIIEVELELKKGDRVAIDGLVDRYLQKRKNSQPLSLPNSGCIFKNPKGEKAGRLIEESGLKGFAVGGAAVSLKHANFIVNKGNASAADVLKLVEHVRQVVWEKTGFSLETEIIVAGV